MEAEPTIQEIRVAHKVLEFFRCDCSTRVMTKHYDCVLDHLPVDQPTQGEFAEALYKESQ